MSNNKQEILERIKKQEPVFWYNDERPTFEEAMKTNRFSREQVEDVEQRMERFKAFFKVAYPETASAGGVIESGLTKLDHLKGALEKAYNLTIDGNLYLKRDDTLPISGTVKARGAIYEVLKHAEKLALENGLLTGIDDDYAKFNSDEFKKFFSQYTVMVGTTGNLGISVGIMAEKFGFDVTVHMSYDAKEWKKELLRSKGVRVVEHQTNFTEAVTRGRIDSESNPYSYFVDDERSEDLFLGYTIAGSRLYQQLKDMNITVDEEHPLFVYMPCGIGGSPGGVAFGLKQYFGDHIHCFHAQPTTMPSMLCGVLSGQYDGVSVADFGLEGKTIMDGLAVPRTSGFVAQAMETLFSGGYTMTEAEVMHWLSALVDLEDIPLEPAAIAGIPGVNALLNSENGRAYLEKYNLVDKLKNATHIAWATGGSMMPDNYKQEYYEEGKRSPFNA
ncbi:D-serine ammonia-lyase [Carnobacteriaceae bacterium zg-ZUI252]|nr:D-serine ammonia-lyase [Carnobacteriaceae bacterium zg-ZUI252]MBS4770845.1 D-serine ammonia-lyase [Carnobacteriaceae bacterium zg-ZUI240]